MEYIQNEQTLNSLIQLQHDFYCLVSDMYKRMRDGIIRIIRQFLVHVIESHVDEKTVKINSYIDRKISTKYEEYEVYLHINHLVSDVPTVVIDESQNQFLYTDDIELFVNSEQEIATARILLVRISIILNVHPQLQFFNNSFDVFENTKKLFRFVQYNELDEDRANQYEQFIEEFYADN